MSGKLNKEEQVQVVIRLKPVPKDLIHTRSVYVSEQQQKTLVVETPNKKEYFVFDNIADDGCSQQEIYQYIGQDAVKSSTDGYNCCIFAYGQTGAGKTYSILGNSQDILNDYYAESRGILPRLLSDLFSWCSNETDRFWIKCSYLEIYNEQIIDLLNPELKLRQMREDFKKGVYVQGLSEENASNYEEAMSILLRGVKNRKTSATSMNDESSRSHTIFTLNIESQFMKEDITKVRRSKINIVDLAGSERAKQTKVQGERLREGCNINRSLHVLGNVINALVQSSKKKKHIPFRDSKLTHFLKDSLCGNSITKLLANIHPSKMYLGDTLSTLMFAKRAKILKMKVEVNENMTENFQELRKEIRKLREELAQARYIKNQQKVQRNISESQNQILPIEKLDTENFDSTKNDQILQIFEQNQINYKALIEVYEEHMKICTAANKNRKNLNMHQQWKNLEKKTQSYRNIVKHVPAFTRIFKENVRLKTEQNRVKGEKEKEKESLKTWKQIEPLQISILKQKDDSILQPNPNPEASQLKLHYQTLLKQIQTKFTAYIEDLESAFEQLENENKTKEERIRELRKRKELPPDLEQLANQNQILKLSILELQEDLGNYEEKERRLMIQIKELKKEREREREKEKEKEVEDGEDDEATNTASKLLEIKQSLQKQLKQFEQQRNFMLTHIDKLKQHLVTQLQESKTLSQGLQSLKTQNKGLKKKLNSLLKINNEIQISKDHNTYTNTFWTNEESNFSEELQMFNDRRMQDQRSKNISDRERDRDREREQGGHQEDRSRDLSNQIVKLHKSYGEEIGKLRDEIKGLERARKQLTEQNYQLSNRLRQFECESESSYSIRKKPPAPSATLAVPLSQIEDKPLLHVRSTKMLQKIKQQKPYILQREKSDSMINNYVIPTVKSKNVLHIRDEKLEKGKKSFG